MLANSPDYDYEVIDAATKGQVRELKRLLEAGGDPNAELDFGLFYTYTAMSEAMGAKQSRAMDMLLSHGANPDGEFDYDAKLAHGAALVGDAECMRVLLNYEPELDKEGSVWMRSNNVARYEVMTPHATAIRTGHEHIAEMIERFQAIPRVTDMDAVTREMLLEKNANGDCALDRPDTWHRIDEVLGSLNAKGETLTKADLMQTGGDGKSYLCKAVECNALRPVLDLLHSQNDGLHAAELVSAKGAASEVLQAIADKFALSAVFTKKNWQGANRTELAVTYQALDDEQKAAVPNYHQLHAQLGNSAELGRRMTGGRL